MKKRPSIPQLKKVWPPTAVIPSGRVMPVSLGLNRNDLLPSAVAFLPSGVPGTVSALSPPLESVILMLPSSRRT